MSLEPAIPAIEMTGCRFRGSSPGELGGSALSGLCHGLLARWVLLQSEQRIGPGLHIRGGQDEPIRADHLGKRRAIGDECRSSATHRFQRWQSKALFERRDQSRQRVGIKRRKLGVAYEARESHVVTRRDTCGNEVVSRGVAKENELY